MKITQQGPLLDTVVSVITGTATAPTGGTPIQVQTAGGFAIVSSVTVDTNAAGTFASSSVASNHVTITAHGYKTGLVGQLTTAGSLPTGLSLSTNYYIIVIDANTVSFASSYANAAAGTAITISGGAGNSTFTPTALAGGNAIGQWSLDGIVWVNDGSPQTITAAATIAVKVDRPPYDYYRFGYYLTAGSLTLASKSVVNKDS